MRVADGVGARRVFLERRGLPPLGAASSGRRRNPVADAFDRALGGIREGTDGMAEQRRKDGGRGTRPQAHDGEARLLDGKSPRPKPRA